MNVIMAIKPTYEELEQRVKELEKEAYTLKQVDEALQESEEKYRSLLDDVIDSSDAGLFILDSDFIVVWVNQALERYFGLKREKVVGKNKRQLIQEQIKYNFEDPEGFAEKVLATYDNNTYVENFECHMLSGNNREDRWLEHWSRPIRSGLYNGGRIELYYNITDRVRAETLLQESEERLRIFISEMLNGFALHEIIVDNNGKTNGYRFLEVNTAFEEITGLQGVNIVGKTVLEVLPKIEPYWIETYGEVALTGKSIRFENYSQELEKYFEVLAFSPKKGQFATVFTDITDRKQAEEALRESERRYRTLFNNIPVGIGVSTSDGRALAANDAMLQMFGYQEAELDQISLKELYLNPEDRDLFMKQFKTVGFFSGLETQFKRKDGTPFYGSITTTPFPMKNVDTLLTVVVDVTQRKQAEEALRESEERFRNVYDTAPLAFVVWDINTHVIDWNKKAKELFGWTKEEVIGNNFFDFLIPEKYRPHVEDVVDSLMKGELLSHSINDNLTKEGKIIICEWNNSALHDTDGNIIGAISLGLDITERKKTEEDRKKLINELQKALKEIKTLRGILPLCSFCKKIRDDKGYWEQVDVYIYKHLQADISHSICPECAKEHYPDLDI
jgi:PAS domain S-box-containing protein